MNQNCLEGMRCPKCGSFEPFKIAITTFHFVYDDDIEYSEPSCGWDSNSECVCCRCNHVGIVEEFYCDEEEPEENE